MAIGYWASGGLPPKLNLVIIIGRKRGQRKIKKNILKILDTLLKFLSKHQTSDWVHVVRLDWVGHPDISVHCQKFKE